MLFKKRELGSKAKTLLSDEAFVNALAGVKEQYMDALVKTKRLDVGGREYLYTALKLLDDVKMHLCYAVEDGKIAAEEIKHLKRGK